MTPAIPNRFWANSRADVDRLAHTLLWVPPERHPELAASIIHDDLMRGPWWWQIIVWFLRKRDNTLNRLRMVYSRMPDIATDLIIQTADHVRKGKDTEDAKSVGGLSQRETDLLTLALMNVGAV